MIKLIIFDMDGTLYCLKDLIQENFNITVKYLIDYQNYSKEDAEKLLIDNKIFPYVSNEAKSSTALFSSLGFDINVWNNYRSKSFPINFIKKENAVSFNTLLKYKEKAHIVLLSNNTLDNIHKLLNHLDIPFDLFEEVVYCQNLSKHVSKHEKMLELINKYRVSPDEALSIGDRYEVDGKPMVELGGKSLIIKKPSSLLKALNDFDNFKTCEEYEFIDGNLTR